jgi:two-component system probable response regulator PhcQ
MPRILLLDDEPHVLSALRRTLRLPLGDRVTLEMHTDPHAALARVGEARFDVVCSDFRMPAMDGVQFLHFVRELQPEAVRMIVSASTEIQGVMSAINEVGVFRYVVKPWTATVLVDDLRAALAQADADRETRALAEAKRLEDPDHRARRERARLESLEPGITDVEWTEQGEVVMPSLLSTAL